MIRRLLDRLRYTYDEVAYTPLPGMTYSEERGPVGPAMICVKRDEVLDGSSGRVRLRRSRRWWKALGH